MKLNYKIIIVALFSMFSNSTIYASVSSITHITLKTRIGKSFERLYCGISDKATFGVDTALGEDDLPPGFPDGLYAYFAFYDSTLGYKVMSYRDIKPTPDKDTTCREFYFQVTNIIDTLTLQWGTLGNEIDSAKLVDGFNYNLFNVDMKKQTSFVVSNPSWERYKVKMWFKVEPTSVNKDKNNMTEICIYPNPCADYIKINGNYTFIRYRLYNCVGIIKNSGIIHSNSDEIETKLLEQGLYFMEIYDDLGNNYIKKFIKQ